MDPRRAIAAHLPGYRVDSVAPLGAGLEHVAYEVNGELVVRFARAPGAMEREARLLAAVAEISPLPVPDPVFAGRDCLGYYKLPGRPLLELPRPEPAIAAPLADLLAALHAVPAERVAGLVERAVAPLAEWRHEAAELWAGVGGEALTGVAAFLAAPVPEDRYEPVLSHNDLGIEHVLVDPATMAVTGIIDWSDAALTDPAVDFGLIYRDLGPDALDTALARYGRADAALRERASFYARCKAIEDLAYGLGTGRTAYVEKSRAASGWLFPAG